MPKSSLQFHCKLEEHSLAGLHHNVGQDRVRFDAIHGLSTSTETVFAPLFLRLRAIRASPNFTRGTPLIGLKDLGNLCTTSPGSYPYFTERFSHGTSQLSVLGNLSFLGNSIIKSHSRVLLSLVALYTWCKALSPTNAGAD